MDDREDRENILANFQVNEEMKKIETKRMTKQYIYFLQSLSPSRQQITAIDDIEVAICHLESTEWNLEVC